MNGEQGVPGWLAPLAASVQGDAHVRGDAAEPATSSVDDQIDALLASRNFNDLMPTRAALEDVCALHPHHARALYELGNVLALMGDEAGARLRFEAAMESGLSGEALRRCLLRYATVLHALGEVEQSQAFVGEVRRRFGGAPSQKVFDAVALHTEGRYDEAFSMLLEVITDTFGISDEDRYHSLFLRTLASPE